MRIQSVAVLLIVCSAVSVQAVEIVEVKFQESLDVRWRDGAPFSLADGRTPLAVEQSRARTPEARWSRLHSVSEERLDALVDRARTRSGRAVDLNSWYRVEVPSLDQAEQLVAQLESMEEVQWAYVLPAVGPSPVPPSYVQRSDENFDDTLNRNVYQRYLDEAPDGIDARFAWMSVYPPGDGIEVCDIEFGWEEHEDLPEITLLSDDPSRTSGNDHGTAVLGQIAALDNGWGATGIAYGAELSFASHSTSAGFNAARAIGECADALTSGDVILLEVQVGGPSGTGPCISTNQTGCVPVSWIQSAYDAIATAVGNKIVVVEAAGNGGNDLDDSVYAPSSGAGSHKPFFPENDTGSIMVGAGFTPWETADGDPRSPQDFSNYGETVDLQAWGDEIVTTGYGAYYNEDGSDLEFTDTFGGTSGASPIVTSAVAILQAEAIRKDGTALLPAEVRTLLRNTGTPQAAGSTDQNIGPQPDLKAALEQMWGITRPAPPGVTPASGTYDMPLTVDIHFDPSHDQAETRLFYTLDGTEPGIDDFEFLPQFGDQLVFNYSVTLKVKAFVSDIASGLVFSSDTTERSFVSTTGEVAAPVITPSGGVYTQPHQVTLSTVTPGATLKYRTDGRSINFFYPGTEYTGPITLDPGDHELSVRAFKDGYYSSPTVTSGPITVLPTVLSSPDVFPVDGEYFGSVQVEVLTSVSGSEIRYTIDGSDPTETSPLYVEPVRLESSATFKASVFHPQFSPSLPTTRTYTVVDGPAIPVITPDGGTATGSLSVSLSTASAGALITWTDNGAEPQSFSQPYVGPIVLGVGETTVKARAFLDGLASPVASASFTVYESPGGQVADPVMTPFSTQTFPDGFTFDVHCDTEGAEIRYTFLDGGLPTDPTQSSLLFTNPFHLAVNGNWYFKVRAFKAGMSPSNIIQSGQLSVVDALGTTQVPTFDPPAGTYNDAISVTISGGPFETIFYTRDGSEPVHYPPVTFPSQQYSTPVSISQSVTLTATGYRPFFSNGGDGVAHYSFEAAEPSIEQDEGRGISTVSIISETPSATIRYTLDGSEPTSSSILYDGPFDLGPGEWLVRARAFRNGFADSSVDIEVVIVNEEPVAPTFTVHPQGQALMAGGSVTLTAEATGTPEPEYRWLKDGATLAGETEPQLVIAFATLDHGGTYTVEAINEGGTTTSDPAVITVDPGTTADLSLTKVDSADPVASGTVITYTLTVDNAGPDGAENVVVTDTLPTEMTLVATSGCSEDPLGSPTCTLGQVPAGSSASFTITAQLAEDASGDITNTATVDADTFDDVLGNEMAEETTSVQQVQAGDGNGDLSLDSADLGTLLRDLLDSGFVPLGNTDCDLSGEVLEEDILCLLDKLFD